MKDEHLKQYHHNRPHTTYSGKQDDTGATYSLINTCISNGDMKTIREILKNAGTLGTCMVERGTKFI